jgi:hypothetical protein
MTHHTLQCRVLPTTLVNRANLLSCLPLTEWMLSISSHRKLSLYNVARGCVEPEIDRTDPPQVNNREFLLTFAQSFIAFAISQDPNDKIGNASVLPQWSQWEQSHTEMVFNVTADARTNLTTKTTDEARLERCRLDFANLIDT